MVFIEKYRHSSSVIKMQSIMLPSFPQLKGEEAIAAVNSFIRELGKRDKKLTKKQAKTLNQFAKGIISSIKGEQHQT
jgi:phosphatidylinositol kinase/protein kinase (PI-3  family)